MKHYFLILGICLACLFYACKPDFDLNAPYKDVTVVYGLLNHQDTIHYVKIYKGYQSHKQGAVFINAQNPDSIYYYNQISVVLQEFDKDKRTLRKDIPLNITHDFPRDSGFFYYNKERIIYYTKEPISKNYSYKIVITNLQTGKITEGITQILGKGVGYNEFEIHTPSNTYSMLGSEASVSFFPAQDAQDYEFHVSFIYFEVDRKTNQVLGNHKIVKNICPKVGNDWKPNDYGYFSKKFTKTFYEDIAAYLEPDPSRVRYIGTPGSNGTCIEIEGWAAGESIINYLLSNQPTSSFVQIGTKYTNLTASEEGLAFGFLSSRVKCPTRRFAATKESEDSLVKGSKTSHLGFRPYIEYKP
jgi:hypothetical protein